MYSVPCPSRLAFLFNGRCFSHYTALPIMGQQVTNTVPTRGQNSVGPASDVIAYYSSAVRGTTVTTNAFFLDGAMSGRKNVSRRPDFAAQVVPARAHSPGLFRINL